MPLKLDSPNAPLKINDPSVSLKINSHNEWDKLLEIIVGTAQDTKAILTWPRPDPIPEDIAKKAFALAAAAYPQWFADEVQEDLDGLANTLTKFGVKVHRPKVHDISRMYS